MTLNSIPSLVPHRLTSHKKVNRHTRVAGIIPNDEAVFRLVGAPLVEADEEWQVQRRYLSRESIRELYEPDPAQLGRPTPLTLAPVHLRSSCCFGEAHQIKLLDRTLAWIIRRIYKNLISPLFSAPSHK